MYFPASALKVPGRQGLHAQCAPSNPLSHTQSEMLADPGSETVFIGHEMQAVAQVLTLYSLAAHKAHSCVPLMPLNVPGLH